MGNVQWTCIEVLDHLIFLENGVDKFKQSPCEILPVDPFVNLCLHKVSVIPNFVTERKPFPGHHKVSCSELQARAVVTFPVS